jgi:hypothetical protein
LKEFIVRELTLVELELVAGGENTIVVTGDRDGGDYGDYGGDSGWYDQGDYGGGGGGGGDTGYTPPEPQQEIVVTAPHPTASCPVNDWWPNFLEDWGDVKSMSNVGPWQQFWTDNSTWCFYDANDNLVGKFVQDPAGTFHVTFSGTDGEPSVSGGAGGFSGGYGSNDSNGYSYTIPLSPVPF